MAVRELLRHSGKFLDGKFRDLSDLIMRFKDHREGMIRRAVIALIPELARFDPIAFSETQLKSSMGYLLGQLKKEKDRSAGNILMILNYYY